MGSPEWVVAALNSTHRSNRQCAKRKNQPVKTAGYVWCLLLQKRRSIPVIDTRHENFPHPTELQ